MRLTQKLLSYLNRVFDKDPGKFLALRLQYEGGGMTWRIEDGVLYTTVTGGPGSDLVVDLSQYRLADLMFYLASQPGYEIAYGVQGSAAQVSALALMDGEGDISRSNGDHLYAYTSLLWAYMEAVASELKLAAAQIPEALKQMSTRTAEGEWLDELGGYYGVPRIQGEPDVSYGPRIIAEVLRPRGNNVAMEAAIKVYTGQDAKVTDVTLYGPVFPLHDATIFYNGAYNYDADAFPYYGLFDVEYDYDFINGGDITQFQSIVREVIDRLRDAGTHLRSLLLRGSDMSDSLTPPTDGGPVEWQVGADLDDTLPDPDDPDFGMSSTMAGIDDTLAAPDDEGELTVSYNYQYNGIRYFNGQVFFLGGQVVTESV